MPDTYLQRGDIIRTAPDGSTSYLRFNVAKALEGIAGHDLILSDRDQIELYPLSRMRLEEQVTLGGPFTQAGTYPFHEGMRVSDLIFLAGIPKKEANRMGAELARTRSGMPSEIRNIDLSNLLSTEAESPVDLIDDTKNPRLKADDHVLIFEKPDSRIHRAVHITGQVNKPGTYILSEAHPLLSSLIARAGGFTTEAMPQAGLFLRHFERASEGSAAAKQGGSPSYIGQSAGTFGIPEILDRLNETKMLNLKSDANKTAPSGAATADLLFKLPVLHGLTNLKFNRVVVDFKAVLGKEPDSDIELLDGDSIIIPRKTDTVMILGETATPFAFYKLHAGMRVGDLIKLAGGMTRNADTAHLRLLKVDGRIIDRWVSHQSLEAGDTVLVPQVIRRDIPWQETAGSLTPLAILINAVRR